ncbi:MAG: DNA repair protein RecO C-terminal domain-containing protein [Holosporales bacterium]|nr:DNA repair protein RecO C-terminal domain-containing protein [Holosporales bacterium]
MILWTDRGVVISIARQGEKYQIVNIFTENHGNFSGRVFLSRNNRMAIFSNVDVNYRSQNTSSLGFWQKKYERQKGWICSMNSVIHLLACQSICYILSRALPHGVPYKSLFEFINYFSCDLHSFSALTVLNLYAYFEFLFLNSIGFGIDLNTCFVCEKNEDIEYISLKVCRGVSQNCSYKLDSAELCSVPRCWKNWKNENIHKSDILNSINITGFFIKKHINIGDNYFRYSIQKYLDNVHY